MKSIMNVLKRKAVRLTVFGIFLSLLSVFFIACSDGSSGGDKDGGASDDSAVATWIQNSDNSNFYIFYADNTVELYQSNKLTLTRNELTYEGNPASESVVTIKNKAGISINKFVILSDGGILTAKDSADSSKVFTVQKTSSDNGGKEDNSGGNQNSGNNESGNNGNGGNNVVCTYYMKGKESTYYVFYADNTAEYYSADKLANSRSEIKYDGNPLKAGTVTIKIALTNTPLITFTVKEADGTLIPYVELVPGFPTEFTLEKSGEDGNQNSGNDNNNGGSENQGDESEPIDTPAQSDTNTDVLCAWIADSDSSNYYIFYTDNTAEYYAGNVLQSTRNALTYTGSPSAEGTVKITNKNTVPILIAAGKGTLTFTLKMSDSCITAWETSSGLIYIVTTNIPSSTDNNNDGDNTTSYSYDIITIYSEHGSITADKGNATAGEIVTLTVIPNDGYELDNVFIYDDSNNLVSKTSNAERNEYTFTMPESNVHIQASFMELSPETYEIASFSIENGSITVDKSKAAAGETVTLTIVPDDGYELDYIYVYDSSNNSIPITEVIIGEEYSFIMPKSEIYLQASCKVLPPKTYEIAFSSVQNGSITADKTTATAGEIVTLTAIPDNGYELDYIYVYDSSNNSVPPIIETIVGEPYTFSMPESNVTVEYMFKVVLPSYSVIISSDIINGTVTTSKTSAKKGESVMLIITQDEGYDLKELIVADSNGNNISNGASVTERPNTCEAFFTMPDSDVLVSATFKGKITILSGIENGTVSANRISASQGESVSLSLSPDDGYELSSVTVTDDAGNVITFTDTWNWVQVCEYRFIMPERRVFVSATFTSLPSYTVTFDSNGGSKVESQNIMTGKTATMPENPTKIGYVFMGWYTSNNFESQYKFNFTSIIKDEITLYAKWGSPIEDFVFVIGSTYNGSSELNPPSDIFTEGNYIAIKDLFVCEHEVTQAEYETYCKYSVDGDAIFEPEERFGKGDNFPAYYVSWYDAVVYCNLRSMAENLTPVYSINGITNPTNWTGIVSANGKYCGPSAAKYTWETITFNASANGYRLPTEAEWEYIARGGIGGFSENHYFYSGSDSVDDVAWYYENSNGKAHEVRTKLPNTLGIYNMSGNVWEWCWDIADITSATAYDGYFHVIRGGSCDTYNDEAFREWLSVRSPYAQRGFRRANIGWLGFRVVRNAE